MAPWRSPLTSETLAGQEKKTTLGRRGLQGGKKRGGVVVGDISLLLLSPAGISSHGSALCNEGGRNSTLRNDGARVRKRKGFFDPAKKTVTLLVQFKQKAEKDFWKRIFVIR